MEKWYASLHQCLVDEGRLQPGEEKTKDELVEMLSARGMEMKQTTPNKSATSKKKTSKSDESSKKRKLNEPDESKSRKQIKLEKSEYINMHRESASKQANGDTKEMKKILNEGYEEYCVNFDNEVSGQQLYDHKLSDEEARSKGLQLTGKFNDKWKYENISKKTFSPDSDKGKQQNISDDDSISFNKLSPWIQKNDLPTLKSMAKCCGQPTSGNKSELVERLLKTWKYRNISDIKKPKGKKDDKEEKCEKKTMKKDSNDLKKKDISSDDDSDSDNECDAGKNKKKTENVSDDGSDSDSDSDECKAKKNKKKHKKDSDNDCNSDSDSDSDDSDNGKKSKTKNDSESEESGSEESEDEKDNSESENSSEESDSDDEEDDD